MTTLEPNTSHTGPRPPAEPDLSQHRDEPRPAVSAWTTGRVVALVVALTALAGAAGLLLTGGAVLAIDGSWREDGYLTSDEVALTTTGYAVAADGIDLSDVEPWWPGPDGLLGSLRIRVTNSESTRPVFIGVAPADRAAAYLAGVDHSTLTEIADPATDYVHVGGGAPDLDPAESDIWTAQASGVGTQTLDWPVSEGVWTVVVMNADGSSGVEVATDAGATVPISRQVGVGLLVAGTVLGSAAAFSVWIATRRTRRPAAPSRGSRS